MLNWLFTSWETLVTSWWGNWCSNSWHTRKFSFPSLLFSYQRHQRSRTPLRTTSVSQETGFSGGTYETSPEVTLARDEKHIHESLRQTITYTGGRYRIGLLWKLNACLRNNYFAAAQHFEKTKTSFLNHPDKLAKYQDTDPNMPGKLLRVSNAKTIFNGNC